MDKNFCSSDLEDADAGNDNKYMTVAEAEEEISESDLNIDSADDHLLDITGEDAEEDELTDRNTILGETKLASVANKKMEMSVKPQKAMKEEEEILRSSSSKLQSRSKSESESAELHRSEGKGTKTIKAMTKVPTNRKNEIQVTSPETASPKVILTDQKKKAKKAKELDSSSSSSSSSVGNIAAKFAAKVNLTQSKMNANKKSFKFGMSAKYENKSSALPALEISNKAPSKNFCPMNAMIDNQEIRKLEELLAKKKSEQRSKYAREQQQMYEMRKQNDLLKKNVEMQEKMLKTIQAKNHSKSEGDTLDKLQEKHKKLELQLQIQEMEKKLGEVNWPATPTFMPRPGGAPPRPPARGAGFRSPPGNNNGRPPVNLKRPVWQRIGTKRVYDEDEGSLSVRRVEHIFTDTRTKFGGRCPLRKPQFQGNNVKRFKTYEDHNKKNWGTLPDDLVLTKFTDTGPAKADNPGTPTDDDEFRKGDYEENEVDLEYYESGNFELC